MSFDGSGGLPAFWSDDFVPSSSAAFDTAMVMLLFWSDDSVPSSRPAFDLSVIEDIRVAPPVTAATMPLAALYALWRTGLATASGVD